MRRNHKRLQFDFTEGAVQNLDNLVENSGSSTRAEVVRNALRTYESISDMTRSGYEMVLRKDQEERVVIPLPV